MVSHLLHTYADATFYSPITRPSLKLPFAAPSKTPDLYEGFSWFHREEYKHKSLLFKTSTSQTMYYPQKNPQCDQAIKPNILYIVLDTVRWDVLTEEIAPYTRNFSSRLTGFPIIIRAATKLVGEFLVFFIPFHLHILKSLKIENWLRF